MILISGHLKLSPSTFVYFCLVHWISDYINLFWLSLAIYVYLLLSCGYLRETHDIFYYLRISCDIIGYFKLSRSVSDYLGLYLAIFGNLWLSLPRIKYHGASRQRMQIIFLHFFSHERNLSDKLSLDLGGLMFSFAHYQILLSNPQLNHYSTYHKNYSAYHPHNMISGTSQYNLWHLPTQNVEPIQDNVRHWNFA